MTFMSYEGIAEPYEKDGSEQLNILNILRL